MNHYCHRYLIALIAWDQVIFDPLSSGYVYSHFQLVYFLFKAENEKKK